MILDLIVSKEIDGFSAKVNSLEGVESWAENEEDAIRKVLELIVFYFNLESEKEIKVDKIKKSGNFNQYKIVFGRTSERVFD